MVMLAKRKQELPIIIIDYLKEVTDTHHHQRNEYQSGVRERLEIIHRTSRVRRE